MTKVTHSRLTKFLKKLCKGYLNDLIKDAGLEDKFQANILIKTYGEKKNKTQICQELSISEATFSIYHSELLFRIESYLNRLKDTESSHYFLSIY